MVYTTHVSNGTDYDIYAMCVTDRIKLIPIPEFIEDVQEFVKIPPSKFEPFKTGSLLSETVFITVFSYDSITEKIERICEAFQVPSDQSAVIGNDNKIYRAEYGRLWVDLNGRNHYPDY